jgi:hypothetical protein
VLSPYFRTVSHYLDTCYEVPLIHTHAENHLLLYTSSGMKQENYIINDFCHRHLLHNCYFLKKTHPRMNYSVLFKKAVSLQLNTPVRVRVRVRVTRTLQLTVSQSVCLDVEPNLGLLKLTAYNFPAWKAEKTPHPKFFYCCGRDFWRLPSNDLCLQSYEPITAGHIVAGLAFVA